MEPLNAIASASSAGNAVEILAGTQSQTTATGAPDIIEAILNGATGQYRACDGSSPARSAQSGSNIHARQNSHCMAKK
jgi:hypothetical protein